MRDAEYLAYSRVEFFRFGRFRLECHISPEFHAIIRRTVDRTWDYPCVLGRGEGECCLISGPRCKANLQLSLIALPGNYANWGDAYEYLMRHFATESGKSKGQF